jgi:predicted RND superfamily exporter protein
LSISSVSTKVNTPPLYGRDGVPSRLTIGGEGPPIEATAFTTAAGFAALAFSDFDGLRDLGLAGALGSTAGLVMALTIVPVGLQLFGGSFSKKSRV